jgi:hypothetical protein
MGLVATLAALVLGLLINCFGEKFVRRAAYRGDGDVAKVVFLDRVLAHYGPEAKQAREVLRSAVVRVLDQMWSKDRTSPSQLEPTSAGAEVLADKIQELSPKDDTQRSLQAQSMSIVMAIGQTRWLMYEQGVTSISMPLLIVLTFWITALFISFGLFAALNGTTVVSLFVSVLSGAIFLILEMYTPYGGLIEVSSAPLHAALAQLGK